VGTLHALPSRDAGRGLVPFRAALRHQVRYLAARWQFSDDDVDREVFARHTIGPNPVGPREITLWTRRPRSPWDPGRDEVGHLDYRICDLCRLAVVSKIRTSEEWKRRGYASWMLGRSRRIAPEYRWVTSRQMSDARGFWEFVMVRVPGQYRPGKPCEHILASWRHPGSRHWRAAVRG
jgi:hypothetical protein